MGCYSTLNKHMIYWKGGNTGHVGPLFEFLTCQNIIVVHLLYRGESYHYRIRGLRSVHECRDRNQRYAEGTTQRIFL
jgi:hypothetical protein